MLRTGVHAKIRYRAKSGLSYILEIEVIAGRDTEKLTGKIQHIFAEGSGEIVGGDILCLKGKTVEFAATDLITYKVID